jgi:hypothetical protein
VAAVVYVSFLPFADERVLAAGAGKKATEAKLMEVLLGSALAAEDRLDVREERR